MIVESRGFHHRVDQKSSFFEIKFCTLGYREIPTARALIDTEVGNKYNSAVAEALCPSVVSLNKTTSAESFIIVT